METRDSKGVYRPPTHGGAMGPEQGPVLERGGRPVRKPGDLAGIASLNVLEK